MSDWKLPSGINTSGGKEDEIAERNKKRGAVILEGSDKMNEWAERIRDGFFLGIETAKLENVDNVEATEKFDAATANLLLVNQSRWWIDICKINLVDLIKFARTELTSVDIEKPNDKIDLSKI